MQHSYKGSLELNDCRHILCRQFLYDVLIPSALFLLILLTSAVHKGTVSEGAWNAVHPSQQFPMSVPISRHEQTCMRSVSANKRLCIFSCEWRSRRYRDAYLQSRNIMHMSSVSPYTKFRQLPSSRLQRKSLSIPLCSRTLVLYNLYGHTELIT